MKDTISSQAAETLSTNNDVINLLTTAVFFIFVAVEIIKPYRRYQADVAQASFTTNTTAFIFNNIVLTLFSASSLFQYFGQFL